MGELLIGIALLILSILVYAVSGDFPSFGEANLSAGSFPMIIVLLMGSLSIILIVSSWRSLNHGKDADGKTRIERIKYHLIEHKFVYTMMGFFFLYIMVMRYIGFRISTLAFIFGSSCLLSPRRKKDIIVAAVLALVITMGSYYFFQNVLNVRFPRGIL
jgi:putative tricarboxylic transport membrane protein